MRSPRPSPDLLATVALALLGLLVALAPAEIWIRVAVLAPLALVLPGYALAAALFPPGSIPPAERAVYSTALSVAAAVLSGVLAQLLVDLDREVWALLLFAVVLAASAVAQRRRPRPRAAGAGGSLPRPGPLSAAALLAAVVLAGWAVEISSRGARADRDETRFTELWVQPARSGGGPAAAIGVGNHEGRPVSYRVEASRRGTVLAEWEIGLADGRRWQASLPLAGISPARPLLVTLLRGGEVYRRAYLRSVPPS